LGQLIERFFSDAGRGLPIGRSREENYAAGAAGLIIVGSLMYLFGTEKIWAQFFTASGLVLLGLWLGTVRSANRPPLMFQLMTGAIAWAALVYFLFGGGF